MQLERVCVVAVLATEDYADLRGLGNRNIGAESRSNQRQQGEGNQRCFHEVCSVAERMKLTCGGQRERRPWESDYAAARCQVQCRVRRDSLSVERD